MILKVPIITIVGRSFGGALGEDKVYMMENTWYSVISRIMFFYFMEKLGI
jgi:acetyl-CoA carboxylase alpha subunit